MARKAGQGEEEEVAQSKAAGEKKPAHHEEEEDVGVTSQNRKVIKSLGRWVFALLLSSFGRLLMA
ncbi:hypothetical protein STEG23_004604, partial [Scotinomys teguina]